MLETSGILCLLLTSKKDGRVSVSTFDAVTSRTEVLGYPRISIGRRRCPLISKKSKSCAPPTGGKVDQADESPEGAQDRPGAGRVDGPFEQEEGREGEAAAATATAAPAPKVSRTRMAASSAATRRERAAAAEAAHA